MTQEIKLNRLNWAGPVVVLDAATGEIKRIIEDPLNFEEILRHPEFLLKRQNNFRGKKNDFMISRTGAPPPRSGRGR